MLWQFNFLKSYIDEYMVCFVKERFMKLNKKSLLVACVLAAMSTSTFAASTTTSTSSTTVTNQDTKTSTSTKKLHVSNIVLVYLHLQ